MSVWADFCSSAKSLATVFAEVCEAIIAFNSSILWFNSLIVCFNDCICVLSSVTVFAETVFVSAMVCE